MPLRPREMRAQALHVRPALGDSRLGAAEAAAGGAAPRTLPRPPPLPPAPSSAAGPTLSLPRFLGAAPTPTLAPRAGDHPPQQYHRLLPPRRLADQPAARLPAHLQGGAAALPRLLHAEHHRDRLPGDLYLPISPHISLHLPISPHISQPPRSTSRRPTTSLCRAGSTTCSTCARTRSLRRRPGKLRPGP